MHTNTGAKIYLDRQLLLSVCFAVGTIPICELFQCSCQLSDYDFTDYKPTTVQISFGQYSSNLTSNSLFLFFGPLSKGPFAQASMGHQLGTAVLRSRSKSYQQSITKDCKILISSYQTVKMVISLKRKKFKRVSKSGDKVLYTDCWNSCIKNVEFLKTLSRDHSYQQ